MTPQNIILLVVVGLLMVAIIVLPYFTNKKRKKQVEELHNALAVGDTIKTVGGIVGKIVAIDLSDPTEKQFVLETGFDGKKSTMVFDINAIYQVMSKGASAKMAAAKANEEAVETPASEEPADKE